VIVLGEIETGNKEMMLIAPVLKILPLLPLLALYYQARAELALAPVLVKVKG
jgi:hypothetical protein